jgi:CheY-like chemotaxis protein
MTRQGARVNPLQILHVDDEADIRQVVELSLGLDPGFILRSCASGEDALAAAADWPPDMILCDVTMPKMNGPQTLIRLRENPQTAHIPVVFMTGGAQGSELAYFKSLGATGIIAKPFDPMTLATTVRAQLRTAGMDALRGTFVRRLGSDAAVLVKCRTDLANDATSLNALNQIKSYAHALAGAAGIFGFQHITEAARALQKATIEKLDGGGAPGKVAAPLDVLLALLEATQVAAE